MTGGETTAEALTRAMRPKCPTCSWPSRETVNMICQTCGTDYGTPCVCGHVRSSHDYGNCRGFACGCGAFMEALA